MRCLKNCILPAYSAEQFHADLAAGHARPDRSELADVLVQQSNAAIHWMRELGIKWEIDSHVVIDGRYYFEPGLVIHPVGGVSGGLGQLGQWREIATAHGRRDSLRVAGASVARQRPAESKASWFPIPTKNTKFAAARSILCAGGFQANPEMRARYLGPNADLMKVRGSRHDTGEVLMMALALGAKAAGHWQGAHATPIDSTYPDVEIGSKANRYGYPYGITVNSFGQRFFDEGEARHSYTYAKTGWAVLGSARRAWRIRSTIRRRFRCSERYTSFPRLSKRNTIDELAQKIGIEPAVLNHTVREFNNAARKDIAFDATKLDGKCTEGITPKKSNWASPIDKPPYWAFSITGGVTFTFGGLQINEAQVLNTSGNPIRGLYASGDIVGLFFHNYPSCTGQTRNVVFSRLAGRHAAAQGL